MNEDCSDDDVPVDSERNFDFMSRARYAEQTILRGLVDLDFLAKEGNNDAVRIFHMIACSMVERLNQLHIGHASSVLKWPIVLPQDRDTRKIVTQKAKEMRIGSVKAGGPGAIEILDYNTEKGFAIQNLRRLDYARAILAPVPPAYDHGLDESPECLDYPSQIVSILSDPVPFAEETGIKNFGPALLADIQSLRDYTVDSREAWIEVIVAVLRRNKHLVPEKFRDSKCKEETYTVKSRHDDEEEVGKSFTDKSWQGALIARALRGGLINVTSVPGFWGQ